MTLQDILFKGYRVPEAPVTFKHESGLTVPGEHYVPPPAPRQRDSGGALVRDELGLSPVQRKIYDMVIEADGPVSPMDLKGTWTQNHVSLTLAKLFKQGLLTRKKIATGRHRHFVYEVAA